MKMMIDSQIYGFIMLLYSQQLFNQMFVAEQDAEWKKIQPIVKELHESMTPEHQRQGYVKAIAYNGLDNITFTGPRDLWFIMYAMCNYRVPGINLADSVTSKHEKILYYVLVNVCKKSHKNYNKFGSRFI